MFHLIGFVVTGLIVGLLARLAMPGRDEMGWGTTALLGMLGALIVGGIGRALNWYGPEDSAGFLFSTLGAMILLALYRWTMRGKQPGTTT